ncbi:DUF4097 family beta strand repeat-containing protein [Paenibacillus sp. CMAA1739]|uniref:DUF4097 family beta strand repeat-containing protein n=1 Tax=Paenibacillus ottowii TaxID=2315729 RepID=UPI00273205EB|nr:MULTISPECIES: DUF4097 family beta strand repeat-containing protein [Paenibacillus]MDP1511672.1 DUF4097 family beta strand repeat-containing protein [Paenibacillus ottowii]MEC4567388.1 DUF4097 family beta strand repeat-containing protein [Paenibacillus sp. CMAA1739]
MHRKIRVGRYTASLLLMAVGILLIVDVLQNTEYMLQLLVWWPVIFVLWGLEYLIFFGVYYRKEGKPDNGRRFRPDLKGILSALVVTASVFIVTQQNHYMYLWNRVSLNLTSASMDFSQAKENRYDMGGVLIPVTMQTSDIVVDSVNGDITLIRRPVSNIEVRGTLWVDQAPAAEADKIAEGSSLTSTDGKTIQIRPEVQSYGASSKRQPRMNMLITVPEDRRFNMQIRTSNGNITLNGVDAIDSIRLESGNGNLIVNDAIGNVKGGTLNGQIKLHRITGDVDVRTNRGDMQAGDIEGAVSLHTMVGNIQVARSEGDITADTQNGDMNILNSKAKLNASSLNGAIKVHSEQVGGDWKIYSAVGDIVLDLPSNGDFQLEGSSSYGNLQSDFPFKIDSKSISGQNGDGKYVINVEGNSNLTIKKLLMASLPDLNDSGKSSAPNESGSSSGEPEAPMTDTPIGTSGDNASR